MRRMGNWTPSLSFASGHHDDLVSYRKVQLDLWLVDLVGAYNRGQLPSTVYHEVQEFLTDTSTAPCTYRATRKESEIEATKAYTCM